MDRHVDDDARLVLSERKQRVITLIRDHGYERRSQAFQLSSGEWSHDYIDAKLAMCSGARLRIAAEGVLQVVEEEGVEFDVVGGLTMGSDPLAHAIALLSETQWCSVRKEPKAHGKQKLIEGAQLGASDSVLLVDDVVTTGRSILRALGAIEDAGAAVALAVPLVDRGRATALALAARRVRYRPVVTFEDLGIEPVGDRSEAVTVRA